MIDSGDEDDYGGERWRTRACTNLGSTLAALEVEDLEALSFLLDSRIDLTAWVEPTADGSSVMDCEEPDGILIRIDSRGVNLPFPFIVGDVWDALLEVEEGLLAEYEEAWARDDAEAFRENRKRLATRVARTLGTPDQWEGWPGGWEDDIESALIDAVFSANAVYRGSRGGGVHARVTKWRIGRAVRRSTKDLRDLVTEIDAVGAEQWAVEFGSSQPSPGRRATAPGGRTKAATVAQVARVLLELVPPVTTAEAINLERVEEVRRALLRVPGLGKATANYFLMLLGKPGVKPDRMIIRFVANTFRMPGSERVEFVERIVTATAEDLGVEPHVLEHAIWAWQRTQTVTPDDLPPRQRGAR